MADGRPNYAVTGHPVAHSLSPRIHAAFAAQTGDRDVRYGRLDLAPDDFAAGCAAFFAAGGRGLNVTAPHKAAALALCDEASESARLAGAVNTLVRRPDGTLFGDTTDGPGLVNDLRDNLGIELAGARVLVVGAGGAGRGVLAPLLAQAPERLALANRTLATARRCTRDYGHLGSIEALALEDCGSGWDLVVNATAASLSGAVPALAGEVARGAVCYDMAYAANGTPFTAWAQANGARAVRTGIGMLVEQAALSFELWRGRRPQTGPVLRELARDPGITF